MLLLVCGNDDVSLHIVVVLCLQLQSLVCKYGLWFVAAISGLWLWSLGCGCGPCPISVKTVLIQLTMDQL